MRFRLAVLAAIVAGTTFLFAFQGHSRADNPVTVGLDADPTGNTATSVASVESCGSVTGGSTFDIDVWVQDVPPFLAFQFDLYYDPAVVKVVGVNTGMLVVSEPGADLLDVSEWLPDADGVFTMAALDLSGNGTSGSGVLARVTLEAVGTGHTPLALGGGILVDLQAEGIQDADQGGFFDGPYEGGIVWVDAACPAGANDADGDGVDDAVDNCTAGGNPDQADRDSDSLGDWCDDGDGDGRLDVIDNCPNLHSWSLLDADGDGVGDECDDDTDNDGVPDASDNSPYVPNPDQADSDGDGIPDVEDPDEDGDGIDDKTIVLSVDIDLDDDGEVETVHKSLQSLWNGMWEGYLDTDGDTDVVRVHVFALPGSVTTTDFDNDGEMEVVIKDPGQAPGLRQTYDLDKADPDSDVDIIVLGGGDLGLLVPVAQDIDGDGEMESLVWEPELMAGEQVDADLDSDSDADVRWQNQQSDGIDNCPSLANPGQANNDGDAYGDDCDADDDNDGYDDAAEAAIGTVATVNCGLHTTTPPIYSLAWPADVFSGVSIPETTDRVTIGDLSSFVAPVRYLGTNVGTHPGDARWDISPGPGPLPVDINVIDLSTLVAGPTGNPSMFGGARAFSGPACTP